ncbi:SGNH/GDSL hydrolase family protein [Parvularcula dongshanensis]|uniref:Lysophospholipase L1-like esterase n=1 Tax=Parvularcula dongshanensis TaxID=1173995 RepID=A0A840I6A7_9PROT|nr:SGNH/GDSL hydrolase family protein [Parvularcula dongshanensis]MBB4659962.1 lysophospholipase L1-like esterase [Parvularcula dongshanensis]
MRLALCSLLLLPSVAFAQEAREHGWVAAWGTAQQLVEDRNELPVPMGDVTIRQTVQPTRNGETVRVRLSNEFGEEPLVIGSLSIAVAQGPGSAAISEGTSLPLSFSGHAGVTIPPGAVFYTDEADFSFEAFGDVAVTMHVVQAPDRQSGHPGSRTTSHFESGEHVGEAVLDGGSTDHWYVLSTIEVPASEEAASIGVIGDSITDGRGSTTNGNDRWTDFLARRLQANEATDHLSVVNLGLGGNCVLRNCLGPNVLARLDRDVLAQPNMDYLIFFEGINDIGGSGLTDEGVDGFVADMTAGLVQIAERARAAGVTPIGATIAPYGSTEVYPTGGAHEEARRRINDWIRRSGTFDAVLDFDAALKDPASPDRLRPAYDEGDGLHPSPAGFEALANAVPLSVFVGVRAEDRQTE